MKKIEELAQTFGLSVTAGYVYGTCSGVPYRVEEQGSDFIVAVVCNFDIYNEMKSELTYPQNYRGTQIYFNVPYASYNEDFRKVQVDISNVVSKYYGEQPCFFCKEGKCDTGIMVNRSMFPAHSSCIARASQQSQEATERADAEKSEQSDSPKGNLALAILASVGGGLIAIAIHLSLIAFAKTSYYILEMIVPFIPLCICLAFSQLDKVKRKIATIVSTVPIFPIYIYSYCAAGLAMGRGINFFEAAFERSDRIFYYLSEPEVWTDNIIMLIAYVVVIVTVLVCDLDKLNKTSNQNKIYTMPLDK